MAQLARETAGWRSRDLGGAHLPYVSCPQDLAALLLELTGQPLVAAGSAAR